MSTFETDLREGVYRLAQYFPSYEEALTQAMFALVTREHVLWYSRPGRAKSMVARALFEMFDGANVFNRQLTKDMLPEQLFGNIIPDELMKTGAEIYNLNNGIAECDLAYLDEFFDASDMVLRALLNVLNEREFLSKDMGIDGIVKCPLHTAICTTNYMRLREATDAVVDRIMCKAVLQGVDGVAECMRAGKTYLGFAGERPPLPKLAYDDLQALAHHVQSPTGVYISEGIQLLHVLLVKEFEQRRLAAAQSKWADQQAEQTHLSEESADALPAPQRGGTRHQ